MPKSFVAEHFSVSLISGIEKVYPSEGYVTIFEILSSFLCVTVPKSFVGEPFAVSLIAGIKKIWMRGWREYRDFPSKFLTHCTEFFHWKTLWSFRKILLSKISMHRRRGILVLSKVFVSQDRNEKICKRTRRFSGSFLVSKKFMIKRGHITNFYRKFVVSQYRETS